MPIASAVRAFASEGAERYAIVTETTIKTAVVTMLGHRNSVCVSGIRPVMASSDGGIEVFVAINIAADEESPSDQKLLPPAIASFAGDSPRIRPKMKTMTMPANANASGSGNQRSLQLAIARPIRANVDSRSLASGGGTELMLHGRCGVGIGDVH